LAARLTTLFCKKEYCQEIQKLKTGCSLAEFSKEGYDPKNAALPMMMTMMIMSTHTDRTTP
jgi:hypothetical protein